MPQSPRPSEPTRHRILPRHPWLMFVLVAALAAGATALLLGLEVVAHAADALNLQNPAALLPPG